MLDYLVLYDHSAEITPGLTSLGTFIAARIAAINMTLQKSGAPATVFW